MTPPPSVAHEKRTAPLTLAHELAEATNSRVRGVTGTSRPTLVAGEASFLVSWFGWKRFLVTIREYDAGAPPEYDE